MKVSQWQVVGVELDLYIPSLRIAIEYDGYQWHHNKLALDERKGEICRRFGIRLIRIREPGLPQASRCERVIVLDDSGEAAFAEAICTLFRWLNLPDPAPDIARDRPAILETYRDVTARAWDQSYQAVYRYHRRHGTLSIPADLTSPSGVNLAGWLHSQREAYRSNELTALQIQKLEALGMQWAPFEARWQRMYQLAAAYAQRHGDLRIPHDYVTEEHVRLGSWLAHQRELYRKQALTPQRVNRLEQLGICWAPNQSRRQEYLQAAQAYHQATGGLDIPADCTTETGLRLGAWLANQRKRYRAGTLSSRRIRELEALGVQWEPPSPDRWEEMFSLARAYYQDHGHLRIGVSYVTEDGRALGRWIAQQRRKFRRGAGEGVRAAQEHQKHRLDEIGMVWDPYWERWWEKYQVAKTYYQAHGHLNLPVNYVTEEGVKLGMWLSSQRQAMRGNPNFLMTPERKALLDQIGMHWTLRRMNPNARRRP